MDKLEPDETVNAWLAGFIDGDGSITISEKHNQSKRQLSPYFELRVSITNISKAILLLVNAYFGGSVSSGWDSPDARKHRVYSWTIQGNMARGLLKDILPYLKLKRPQAEVGIRLQDTILKSKSMHVGMKLDDSTIQIRLLTKAIVHRLNEPEMMDYNVNNLLKEIYDGRGKGLVSPLR
uniref:Putative homing endonuclease n=1 Tax=viral metagenome TaxID=1070528 RepID=A0A6M3MB58_9ZZZZ